MVLCAERRAGEVLADILTISEKKPMYSLGFLALVSLILALVLTPAARNLAWKMGWVDAPVGDRRIHKHPVPRLGGAAVVAAYLGAFAVLLVSGFKAGAIIEQGLPFVWRLIPGVAVIFLTGLLDDIRGLKPWQKLAGQMVGAGLAIWAGVALHSIAGVALPTWMATPLTLLWLVGCTNAFNLIDGVDGLAAGVGLFATSTILLAALIHGNVPLALATTPLAGALLGFLRYNFNPASIFLGDSGSLTIGFLLGCFGAVWSQKAATVLGLTAPLMALAIPLLDTTLAMVRRFLRRKPIWEADRDHIHHRLLERGLTPRRVVLLLYAAAALGASCSITLSTMESNYGGIAILVFCAAAWIGIQHLGYVELGLAGRMFLYGAFRRQLNAQLALMAVRQALSKAGSPEDFWRVIEESRQDFGCEHAAAKILGQTFGNGNGSRPGAMRIHIPFEGGDYVLLERSLEGQTRLDVLAAFADAIGKGLEAKLPEFRHRGQVRVLSES